MQPHNITEFDFLFFCIKVRLYVDTLLSNYKTSFKKEIKRYTNSSSGV